MEFEAIYVLCELLGKLVEWLWDLYRRVLNLPILVAAVADGAAGVAFGVGMMGSASAATWLLGLVLAAFSGLFAGASVVSWIGKVRGEREDAEYRLRRVEERAAIAGREAGGLDSRE